jgi:glycosyltransferase involved in cell wall biosynthesis
MQKEKLVIAHIWPAYSGKPESRINVLSKMDNAEFIVIGIYLTRRSDKPNPLEEKGFKAFYLSEKKKLRFFSFRVLYRLVKILKAQNVNIIHSHRDKAMVYGTIAGVIARTPAIVTQVHGFSRTRNWHRRLRNFFIMKKIDKVLTVGEAVREDVLMTNPSIPARKVYSVGNSIDFEKFANVSISCRQIRTKLDIPQDAVVFGTVGRLTPSKGQMYLLDAFAVVKKVIANAQLVIIGDGPFRAELEKRAVINGIAESTRFLGRRNDVPELLRALNVFVLPSIGSEGLPRALMEAMASEIPCISTTACGMPEILGNGEFGFLVPPADGIALADRMLTVLKMPKDKLKEITEKAKQKVKDEYTYEAAAKRKERIYRELTAIQ